MTYQLVLRLCGHSAITSTGWFLLDNQEVVYNIDFISDSRSGGVSDSSSFLVLSAICNIADAYSDFGGNYQRKNDLYGDRPGPAVFTMPTGRAAYRLISHGLMRT